MSDGGGAWVVEVFLHQGRYHGSGDWPPSPARLFQALVAGAARGRELGETHRKTLTWLETLEPPVVGAPVAVAGQDVKIWVPNNDLDAKRGDPAEVAHIRSGKRVQPRLFDPAIPFLYAWRLPAGLDVPAEAVQAIADELYQLGRGIDLAWARGIVEPGSALDARLEAYRGRLYAPTPDAFTPAQTFRCPRPGTLASLERRFAATLDRFGTEGQGRKRLTVFRQPPKPRFRAVAYESPPARTCFELRHGDGRFAPQSLRTIAALTEAARDLAAAKLSGALPDRRVEVEQALLGRTPEGHRRLPADRRVRLIPVPSIGHEYADRGVRRILVEVPGGCPIPAADVCWALSGASLPAGTAVMVRTSDEAMLEHYGLGTGQLRTGQLRTGQLGTGQLGTGHRIWRTVTPAALPESAARRRLPQKPCEGHTKGATERAAEEREACARVEDALRHAGVRAPVAAIRVQREPFSRKGMRAEAFAPGTRFAKERLWHIELHLDRPVSGPLLVGDGRFVGLGLMAPFEPRNPASLAFRIVTPWRHGTDPVKVARALRRAVMARYQLQLPPRAKMPLFVSGHQPNGKKARDHAHLYFVCEVATRTLWVIPPHVRDGRPATLVERRHLARLRDAMVGFETLRAGSAGVLRLSPQSTVDAFPVATRWVSQTPYTVERHWKRRDASRAVREDLRVACRKLGWPEPEVDVASIRGVCGLGLTADVALTFPSAVSGPVLLGRTRYRGGGWFAPAEESET